MNKRKRNRNRRDIVYNSILIVSAFLITMLAIINGAYLQEGYEIQVGEPSPRKFKATRKVENRIATERNRAAAEEAAAEMKPLLKKDPAVDERITKNLDSFFALTDDIRKQYREEKERLVQEWATREEVASSYDGEDESSGTNGTDKPDDNEPLAAGGESTVDGLIISKGAVEIPVTFEGEPEQDQTPIIEIPSLPVALSDTQTWVLMEADDEEYEILKESVAEIIGMVLEQGLQEVDAKNLSFVKDELEKIGQDSQMQSLGYEIITAFLEPNYVVDEAATEKSRQDIAENYVTVVILKDETIVDEGIRITEEAFDILDSLGLISKGFSEKIPSAIGGAAAVSVIFIVALLYINTFHSSLVSQRKETLLLFIIYALTVLLCWLCIGFPYLAVPVLVFTMIVAMLVDVRMAMVLNICVTLIALLIYKGDAEFLFFYSISGLAISYLASFTKERSKMLVAGFWAVVINVVLAAGIYVFFERNYSASAFFEMGNMTELLYSAGIAALNGLFTVIICMGSLPIWEAAFGVVTPIKLLDLINPNCVALRRLAIEAPGTYHHSLIVANLAESAAYDIGANPSIASVGGYYHDIGKLKYPQYFIENQVGENPHSFMDAYSSAQVIFSHVTYGLELADTFKLPKIIKDMINQHHGNTLVRYFYHKAKNASAGVEINCEDFRYKGEKPQTKEAAILMLADTIEAAVRSMIPNAASFDQVEQLINTLIKEKLDDGQLDDSDLTIKNINQIAKSFMRVFRGMYHERIQYPKDDDDKTKSTGEEEKTEEPKDEEDEEKDKP